MELKTNKKLDENGFYVIDNYDKKQPFASFLSAIAGTEGTPMWSFYVNRGQVISSIGIKDKSNSIMEFFPANEAYKMVYTNGFRTFVKLNGSVYEPFAINDNDNIKRDLKIKNNELELVEVNNELGLTTKIKYFTVPNENYAAMARKVEVINNSDKELNIEILDGIAAILPYGTHYLAYKEMSNLLRSWMEAKTGESGAVEYKVRTSTSDSTEVEEVLNSYFYVALDEDSKILKTIVDFESIFGYDTSLKNPIEFNKKPLSELYIDGLESVNKVPCAFSGKEATVKENDSLSIFSYIGFVNDSKETKNIVERMCSQDYFSKKEAETNVLIDEIVKHVETKTAYPMFDEYVKQCYVDNVLRGGYPLEIGDKDKKIYYVYSRKHGDLERDYNFFNIEPNYYSQGNGNFRDINQNRRMDIFLHPFVGTENVKLFMNLMQMDGYNPLVIKGKTFKVEKVEKIEEIVEAFNLGQASKLSKLLTKEFTLGELYGAVKALGTDENVKETLLNTVIDASTDNIEADFGEGFWVDHWTYNLDLIEEYLNIYPDKVKELLVEDNTYKFYNSPEYVLPRKERYVLNKKGEVRQYKALAKKEIDGKWLKDEKGEVYNTNLATKLFMLASSKFMTLDQYGIGIEMEAGKPGWNDAMNGLPGLVGSSTAELFELKRLLNFIKKNDSSIDSIVIPVEMYNALNAVKNTLEKDLNSVEYWNNICDIKEQYRELIKDSVTGENKVLSKEEYIYLIDNMLNKIDCGIEKLKNLDKAVVPTFLYYNVTEYDVVEELDNKYIIPKNFDVNYLPEFLEGPARLLKTGITEEQGKEVYENVKASGIYDEKLKMYKTSAPLDDVTFEIGRARGFTGGWLERESIFMHMEYKYVLELIKNGLYSEFFEEIQNVLPPFLDEEVYGRSVLENSSFIASSANPDKRTHGRGFVARLTGTTVELLNMWKLMMTGEELFASENGTLSFKLQPILPGSFFDENGEVNTIALGKVKIKYINLDRKDTFGQNKGQISKYVLVKNDNTKEEIASEVISGKLAEEIRNGNIKEIICDIA